MTEDDNDVEIWLPVPSVPGLQASSHGRLLLPTREYSMPNGSGRKTNPKPTLGKISRSHKTAKYVYRSLPNRIVGTLKVHRVVCEAFHGPAPSPNSIVIHIDEDGLNNRPENLRWGTQKENLNMPKFLEYCRSRVGEDSPVIKGRKKSQGDT